MTDKPPEPQRCLKCGHDRTDRNPNANGVCIRIKDGVDTDYYKGNPCCMCECEFLPEPQLPSEQELLPCPFCGGGARMSALPELNFAHVECLADGCWAQMHGPKDRIIASWNTRTAAPVAAEQEDELLERVFASWQKRLWAAVRINPDRDHGMETAIQIVEAQLSQFHAEPQEKEPVTYDAPFDSRCFYCRNQYCHADSFHYWSLEHPAEGGQK